MVRPRRALYRIAIAWLLCQAAAITLAPVGLALGSRDALVECRCAHGDHDICTMHHKPAPGSRACVMTGAGDQDVGVMGWMAFPGVLPPPAPVVVVPEPQPFSLLTDATARSLHPSPPDPPPPRQ